MKLPEWVNADLQPHTVIVWWGRRATYEIVEEVSEAIFKVWLNLAFYSWLEPAVAWVVNNYAEFDRNIYWVVVGIICLMLSLTAIAEVGNWYNEIYIVTKDPVNGGGRVYKFYGWLSKRHIDEPITPNTPTILTNTRLFYRIWHWVTGEKMQAVALRSQNHSYLDGQRISFEFARSISLVRGSRPERAERSYSGLADLDYLDHHRNTGLLDEAEAKLAARKLLSNVYGE